MIEQHAEQAVGDIRIRMEGAWDSLTHEQKTAAARTMRRYLALQKRKQAGEDVAEDVEFLEATVAEFVTAGEIELADAFNDAFWAAAEKATGVLISALTKGAL